MLAEALSKADEMKNCIVVFTDEDGIQTMASVNSFWTAVGMMEVAKQATIQDVSQ